MTAAAISPLWSAIRWREAAAHAEADDADPPRADTRLRAEPRAPAASMFRERHVFVHAARQLVRRLGIARTCRGRDRARSRRSPAARGAARRRGSVRSAPTTRARRPPPRPVPCRRATPRTRPCRQSRTEMDRDVSGPPRTFGLAAFDDDRSHNAPASAVIRHARYHYDSSHAYLRGNSGAKSEDSSAFAGGPKAEARRISYGRIGTLSEACRLSPRPCAGARIRDRRQSGQTPG
jgi:hypothetical protein